MLFFFGHIVVWWLAMTLWKNIQHILIMTVPVMMFQIIEFSNNFIDAIMIGHYDALLLGAVNIGGGFYALSVVFFVGILIITGSLIGQASGAKNYHMMARVVQAGSVLSIIFAIILFIWFMNIEHVLQFLWFDDTLIKEITTYLDGRMFSAFAIMAIPYRMFLVNQKLFKHILCVNILALPLNIVLNYALIYGNFGMPELGLYGGGLATGISMCITTVLVLIFATMRAKKQNIPLWQGFPNIDIYYKKRIVRLGIGIGFFITAEVILFATMNAYAGAMTPIQMAGWSVVFQVWNMLFASVLGMSEACNIYLAHEAGKRNRPAYLQGIWIYLGLMTIWCVSLGILLLVFPHIPTDIFLSKTDKNYAQVSMIAQNIFPLMILGFIAESYIQVINRSLVAVNDTYYMPCMMWICYGGIGTSIGYIWVFEYGGGPMALMWTIIISICLTILMGIWRIYYIIRPHKMFQKVET